MAEKKYLDLKIVMKRKWEMELITECKSAVQRSSAGLLRAGKSFFDNLARGQPLLGVASSLPLGGAQIHDTQKK